MLERAPRRTRPSDAGVPFRVHHPSRRRRSACARAGGSGHRARADPAAPQAAAHAHHRNALREALGRLDLSAAQHSQIDAIFAQARGQNKGADRATRRANRKQLRSQIDAVLTPAQRTRLRDMLRAERRAPAQPAPH